MTSLPRFPLEPDWYDAVPVRVSRRRFDGRPVAAEALARVDAVCRRVSDAAAPTARAVLVEATPEGVFKGLVGGYGAISGAPAFVAFVGRDDWQVDLGFVGEAVILAATAAGLDTCWIAGSFHAAAAAGFVELSGDDRVRAVTPLGYGTTAVGGGERLMHAVMRTRARVDLERIAPGAASWPAWARDAAEAVRLAPSGQNRQPWRLRLEPDGLAIDCTTQRPYWTARIDCGVAALHAELGALHAGVHGTWSRLDEPGVARFAPA